MELWDKESTGHKWNVPFLEFLIWTLFDLQWFLILWNEVESLPAEGQSGESENESQWLSIQVICSIRSQEADSPRISLSFTYLPPWYTIIVTKGKNVKAVASGWLGIVCSGGWQNKDGKNRTMVLMSKSSIICIAFSHPPHNPVGVGEQGRAYHLHVLDEETETH